MNNIRTLFLVGALITFITSLSAQDYTREEILENNGKVYNEWLISTKIGEIIEYDTISIDTNNIVTYKFKGVKEENDPKYLKVGWENMQKTFYETERESLHNRLFKTLSMLTSIHHDSLKIEINSNDVKKYSLKITANKKGNPSLDVTNTVSMSVGDPVKVKVSEFKSFKKGDTITKQTRKILSEKIYQFLEKEYKNKKWSTYLWWYGNSKKIPNKSKLYYEVTCLQNEVLRNDKFEKLIIIVHLDRLNADTYNVSVEVNCWYYTAWDCSSAEKFYDTEITKNSKYEDKLEQYVEALQEKLLDELTK